MLLTAGVSLEARIAIEDLYATYVQLLDGRDYQPWIDLFTEDCRYVVKARENEDRGLPLAALAFESKGMLRDRIYGITTTLFHEPYYQRHIVSSFRMRADERDGYAVDASYLVCRTKVGELTEVYSTGRYRDRIVVIEGAYRFAEKCAIYDSELIPNSLIYPL
jgi:salicylate 5-hydroxylase small subunit